MRLDFQKKHSLNTIVVHYASIVLISSISAFILSKTLWSTHLHLAHTILELSCVFFSLSFFLLIWNLYTLYSPSNLLIGFGFLAVAVFDVFHTYFYPRVILSPDSYFDASTRFWIIGRLTEAVILYISIHWQPRNKPNKYISLFTVLLLSFGISYMIIRFESKLPILLTEHGVTPLKRYLEYGIILIFLLALKTLYRRAHEKGIVAYKYMAISILVAITTEYTFTKYTTLTSYQQSLGHILKAVYYFYLYKAIFVGGITHTLKELEASKAHTLEVLDTLPTAIAKFTKDLHLSFANQKTLDLLGCKRQDIDGKYIYTLTNTYYKGKPSSSDIRNGIKAPAKNEIRTIVNTSGEEIAVLFEFYHLNNEEYIVFIHEAAKEQELENLKLQTNTILNTIDSAVIMLDQNMNFVMCNKAFEQVFQIDSQELLGLNFCRLDTCMCFSPTDWIESIITSKNYSGEVSFIDGDRKQKYLLVYASPILNINDAMIGVIVIGSDVTDLKLQQEKSVQQEKLALLGKMGAEIVHETKNYLAAIKARSQLLALIATDEKTKQHAKKIDQATNEVNRIIVDFLSLSKPRKPVLEKCMFNDLILSMSSMIESMGVVKGITLDICFAKHEKPVLCDEALLKQVVLNISKNAIEAMEKTKNPKLKLLLEYKSLHNEMMIHIIDNGIGISKEDLAHIGSLFFSTKSEGTGLGLNFCFRTVREQGGKILVDSTPEKGTIFTICFPCAAETLQCAAGSF